MSEEQRRQLQQQLWNIANALRGKMNADEFRDYILGCIQTVATTRRRVLAQEDATVQQRLILLSQLVASLSPRKKLQPQ